MAQRGLPVKQDFVSTKIHCDLIEEAVVMNVEINESVSNLFRVDVVLQTKIQIDIFALINAAASISFGISEEDVRFFSGLIEFASFENLPSTTEIISNNILYLRIVPSFSRAALNRKYRIFQNLSTKDIIQKILKENNIHDVRLNLNSNGNVKREFSVQYGESDFHYISRLMEEEGIFYYIDCDHRKDILNISNNSVLAERIKNELKIKKSSTSITIEPTDVYNVSFSRSTGTRKIECFSFNDSKASVIQGVANNTQNRFNTSEKEFCHNLFAEKTVGDAVSKIILERENAVSQKLTGKSYAPSLIPGNICKISGSTSAEHNGEFFVLSVKHVINQITDDLNAVGYWNYFEAIPSNISFRPANSHRKNMIFGCQTAIVTGPSGEEIFNDENARIKVRFYWDSQGTSDGESSCWLRCAQSWAGNGFGGLVIPRVGMEVLVSFIDGDPDQPIVVGCVYNGVNRPPSNYPKDNNTISTFYTSSSKEGSGFNELRFNDKSKNEEIFVHAQKDMNIVVENNKTEVLNDGSRTVIFEGKEGPVEDVLHIKKGGKKIVINEGDYVVILDKGDNMITLQDGSQTIKLSNGNLMIEVNGDVNVKSKGDMTFESDGSISIKSGGSTTVQSKGAVEIDATRDFKLKAMKGEMKMQASYEISGLSGKIAAQTALDLSGMSLKISATASFTSSSGMTTITSSAAATISSSAITTVSGGGGVAISGPLVKLG
jgi:type VI secretion system secreted protein VgrG